MNSPKPSQPFAAHQYATTAHLPECPRCFTPAGYACVEGRSDDLYEVPTHTERLEAVVKAFTED